MRLEHILNGDEVFFVQMQTSSDDEGMMSTAGYGLSV